MKTIKVVLILLIIVSIILAWLFFNARQNCDPCEKKEQDISILSSDNDFGLKIDCTKEAVYQVFQYDLANGYSIMGKIQLDPSDSSIVEKIDFKIYEAGTCKRYAIEKVSYQKYDGGHLIDFYINSNKNDRGIPPRLNEKISVAEGQRVFARINSEDFPHLETNLPSVENSELSQYKKEDLEGIVRHFPPLICPAKIYVGINN